MPREKYKARWPDELSDLGIELACIGYGGKWVSESGTECGAGMVDHLFNARKLIWPERYRHRWSDLLYENFVANDITILMGCASSQKTSHASEYVLLNYWARPHKTLVVLSTVTREKLDTGVFGEVKMLWQMGKKRWSFLAGNLLENKQSIYTDSLEHDGQRDGRKGIVSKACFVGGKWVGLGTLAGTKQEYLFYLCDECFPAGTMVDTLAGPIPIEKIRPGMEVISAAGPNRVIGVRVQQTQRLCKIRTVDGREIICTPNHKFFTNCGWVMACNLNQEHYMLAPDETLRILRQTTDQQTKRSAFLFAELSDKMDAPIPREKPQTFGFQKNLVEFNRGFFYAHSHSAEHDGKQSDEISGIGGESLSLSQGHWPQATGARWQRDRTNESRMATAQNVSRSRLELRGCDQHEARHRLSYPLQDRHSFSSDKTRHRSGRSEPQFTNSENFRYAKGSVSQGAWVESVSLFQPGDPRFPLPSANSGLCGVYNLHVEGHHSYSVAGLVAANCQFMAETFIGSWPNLFSNGNVKIIGSGNPKHDPDDQLGIAAEPKEGWTAHGVVDKTAVWETQFMGGRCVNLVGTDSPNLDVPEGSPEPYPKLIGRKFIKRIASDWGDNSPEFYTQCKGIMRIDMSDKRVITRLLCREHHAQDMVVWSPAKRTMILGLDPSYGGGDECIGTFLAFGTDDQGKELSAILEQKAYVMDMSKNMSMEDQIALSVKEDLRDRGIPASNCFYDPYGKGTMGFAFARVFGSDSPIPIDSGGQPTDRPVRAGLYVEEADGKRHLKTCREHYSKFVTEAWFSVRYIVESEQLRGLPTDCMLEGCARKYETVAGNKIEVESKDDYKGRVKHSPNRFDSLAIAVEGARQRGFGIDKLGLDVDASSRPGRDPFEEDARAWEELLSQSLLNHGDRKRELSLNL